VWFAGCDFRPLDACLEHLATMSRLEGLSLDDVPVTDAVLMRLHNMTRLQSLNLRFAKVTATGVAKLQSALPKCQISVDPAVQKALDEIRNRKTADDPPKNK
jgi:hypothetical protein